MLLLRDVVGYEASEVAAMLKTTPTAVHSGLARARDRMARLRRGQREENEAVPLGAGQRRLLESYLQAWEAGDIDTIVSLLSRDATSIPASAASSIRTSTPSGWRSSSLS
jgi:hypothetical protein